MSEGASEKADKWVWSFFMIPIDEIADEAKDVTDINFTVRQKAIEKFESFEAKAKDFFEIPKNWFVNDKGKDENWTGRIQISATKYFT